MMIFKKTRDPQNEFDRTEVEFIVQDNDAEIGDLTIEFERFLKACGFVFQGEVDIVDDTE